MQTGVFWSVTQFGTCERLWWCCATQCLAWFRGQHQSRWARCFLLDPRPSEKRVLQARMVGCPGGGGAGMLSLANL